MALPFFIKAVSSFSMTDPKRDKFKALTKFL
jgi:hypothetical protein